MNPPNNNRRPPEEQARKEGKETAYATILEELDAAIESRWQGEFHYVVGKDGTLYHALHGEEPEECSVAYFQVLLAGQADVIPAAQAVEFADILEDTND
jgi:hypothetical protein